MEHQPTNGPHHEHHDYPLKTQGHRPDEEEHADQPLIPAAPDAQTEPTGPVEREARPGDPQIERGIREHGDAFRAYLELPDIDPTRYDLLETFREFYIGAFVSMEALLDELTEIRNCLALTEVAAGWGFDEMVSLDSGRVERVTREIWDIVETGGRFHVFDE